MKMEGIFYIVISWCLIFLAGGLATKNNYNDFWLVLFASGLLFGICAVKIQYKPVATYAANGKGRVDEK